MNTILAMCVYDTEENRRSEYTRRTLDSLFLTVDFSRYPLYIIDQNSCNATKDILNIFRNKFIKMFPKENLNTIYLDENIGTARGINLAIKKRGNGHVIKLDNDVIWHTRYWVDRLELAAERLPEFGILGCKRKDLAQHTHQSNPHFISKVDMIRHEPGEEWLFVEKVVDVMGTCVMYTNRLLDKTGYLKQYGVYGWEDCLMSYRSTAAGFYNGFIHPIHIDHIDTGEIELYIKEKQRLAGKVGHLFQQEALAILKGEKPYYFDFN